MSFNVIVHDSDVSITHSVKAFAILPRDTFRRLFKFHIQKRFSALHMAWSSIFLASMPNATRRKMVMIMSGSNWTTQRSFRCVIDSLKNGIEFIWMPRHHVMNENIAWPLECLQHIAHRQIFYLFVEPLQWWSVAVICCCYCLADRKCHRNNCVWPASLNIGIWHNMLHFRWWSFRMARGKCQHFCLSFDNNKAMLSMHYDARNSFWFHNPLENCKIEKRLIDYNLKSICEWCCENVNALILRITTCLNG